MSETQTRTLQLDIRQAKADKRTVPATLSTETPVERHFGLEILDHSSESIDLGRAPLPLLESHDQSPPIGVVENIRVERRRLRGDIRFGSSDRANTLFRDVMNKVVRSLSIGYRIHSIKQDGSDDKSGLDIFRAMRWEPHEVSIVAVPADTNAQFFRSNTMSESETKHEERNAEIEKILGTARAHQETSPGAIELAQRCVLEGKSFDEFRTVMLANYTKQSQPLSSPSFFDPDIGLTDREKKRYSYARAILAQADPKKYWDKAGFEVECSKAVADKFGRSPQGLFVPYDVQKRTLTAGTATDGAELVATDLLASSFIDVLRDRSFALNMGTVLDGLVGDVAIPRKTSAAAVGWVATEGGNVSLSDPQFDQVSLTPKTVGVATEFTRQLLLQSTPSIDGIVQGDLAASMANGIDDAAINGSGASGQPTGLVNQTGVLTSTIATPGSPTWVEVVEFETDVAGANALVDGGSFAYVGNTAVTGNLKTTEKATNTGLFLLQDGRLNGYQYISTNRVAANGLLFGNWQDLVIGLWGTLDLLVDPYTNSLSGTVRVVALQSIDIGVRHPESFSINA